MGLVMVILTVLETILSIAVCSVASLVLIFAIAMGVDKLMDWIRNRRLARMRRTEADLDHTQEQLRATLLQLAEALGQEAHQARKDLIRESFRASGKMPPRD